MFNSLVENWMESSLSIQKRLPLGLALFMLFLGGFVAIYGYTFDLRYLFVALFCLGFSIFFLEYPEATLLFFIFAIPTINAIGIKFGGELLGLNGILSLSLLLCGIFYILLKRVRLGSIPIAFPFLALIGLTLVSFFPSVDKFQTARGLFRFLQVFILYALILETFQDKKKIDRLLLVVVVSLIIPAVVGLWQYISDTGFHRGGYHHIHSTLSFPNQFSRYLLISLSAILALLFSKRPRAVKAFAGVMGLACLALLYSTFSRAAWLGVVAIFVVFAILHRRLGSLALALSPGLFVALNPRIWQRIEPLFKPIPNLLDPSLAWRIFHWREVFGIFLSRPLLGHGLGTTRYYAFEAYGTMKEAHNLYLGLAVELGILGLISFLGILYVLFKETIWVYCNSRDGYFKTLSSSYLALLFILSVLVLCGGAFDLQVAFPLLIVLGAAVGSAKRISERSNHS